VRIDSWDDWYAVEAQAREMDSVLSSEIRPEAISLAMWLPNTWVGNIGAELSTFDVEVRRCAVLLPSRSYSPRLFPLAPILNLPEPIHPADGRLELETANQGSRFG
jgi:hypothetical protein